MAVDVTLTSSGMGITEATIVSWLKAVGDRVEAGEAIAEVETARVHRGGRGPGQRHALGDPVRGGCRGRDRHRHRHDRGLKPMPLAPDRQLELYKRMLRIRKFEEAIIANNPQGHLSIGQEGAIVGACTGAARPTIT
ncbi:MAG: hypothetical protein QM703_28425 [Gemmatales bacterium]